MKIASLVCRLLLGLIFFVFGLNKLIPFIPATLPAGDAGTWALLMVHHHWMAAVGIFETVGGLLLLIGRFVPLGLTLLAPICVNILLFSFLFTPGSAAPGLVATALELFLLYAYRSYFEQLLTAKAQLS